MAPDPAVGRLRARYRRLLRLYPTAFRSRYEAQMEQTFADVLEARLEAGRGLAAPAIGMFVETGAAIARERMAAISSSLTGVGRVALGTLLLLTVPFVAMRVTDEVQWSVGDFAFMGSLLFGTGLAYLLLTRSVRQSGYRLAAGLALLAAFLLVWVNAAVGIIGDPGGPNLMYGLVLAVGVVGAAAARFRAGAMARLLFAMAAAQLLVPLVALVVATPTVLTEPPGVVGVVVLNACFALAFAASGVLFHRAAAAPAAP